MHLYLNNIYSQDLRFKIIWSLELKRISVQFISGPTSNFRKWTCLFTTITNNDYKICRPLSSSIESVSIKLRDLEHRLSKYCSYWGSTNSVSDLRKSTSRLDLLYFVCDIKCHFWRRLVDESPPRNTKKHPCGNMLPWTLRNSLFRKYWRIIEIIEKFWKLAYEDGDDQVPSHQVRSYYEPHKCVTKHSDHIWLTRWTH